MDASLFARICHELLEIVLVSFSAVQYTALVFDSSA